MTTKLEYYHSRLKRLIDGQSPMVIEGTVTDIRKNGFFLTSNDSTIFVLSDELSEISTGNTYIVNGNLFLDSSNTVCLKSNHHYVSDCVEINRFFEIYSKNAILLDQDHIPIQKRNKRYIKKIALIVSEGDQWKEQLSALKIHAFVLKIAENDSIEKIIDAFKHFLTLDVDLICFRSIGFKRKQIFNTSSDEMLQFMHYFMQLKRPYFVTIDDSIDFPSLVSKMSDRRFFSDTTFFEFMESNNKPFQDQVRLGLIRSREILIDRMELLRFKMIEYSWQFKATPSHNDRFFSAIKKIMDRYRGKLKDKKIVLLEAIINTQRLTEPEFSFKKIENKSVYSSIPISLVSEENNGGSGN